MEVRQAYENGVRRYTTDSEEDLNLIIKHAPASKVSVRIKTENKDKEGDRLTGFNDRFGVGKERAKVLLRKANFMGLKAHGIAFHIGTQQEDPRAWDETIGVAAGIFAELKSEGMVLKSLNIGGGFPSRYKEEIPAIDEYGAAIRRSIHAHFKGNFPEEIICEPGRSISAMAGITIGRVINVKPQENNFSRQIVTLSTGRFSAGLFNVGNGMHFFRNFVNSNGVEPYHTEFVLADLYDPNYG